MEPILSTSKVFPRGLGATFLLVDFGLLLYWIASALSLLPPDLLYKDHENPILQAWNWSFLSLDLLISVTGLLSVWAWKCHRPSWSGLAIVSLALSSASGLQAISFWTLRKDFDFLWWAPNLFLLLYPAWFLPALVSPRRTPTMP